MGIVAALLNPSGELQRRCDAATASRHRVGSRAVRRLR
jgi:hypothetical protein